MTQYAYFCYHRKDDNMLETCISSLRDVNSRAVIFIATDGVPKNVDEDLEKKYGVNWVRVPVERMRRRRATCKIEVLKTLIHQAKDGDELLVSDVDIVFLKDPFVPFALRSEMDLGLTTRGYEHAFPINGGVFFIRVSPKMRQWVDWHLKEIYKPTWDIYIRHRKRWRHEHFGLDWSVGQDFLVACWMKRYKIQREQNIKIEDVGPNYNYCPPTDTMGKDAFDLAWKAFDDPQIAVLHLKSELKKMLYDNRFPNAKRNYPKGTWAWA